MNILIDEKVCLVFFVHNLANWHVSCKSNFANKWSNFPLPLEKHEVEVLEVLRKTFVEYLQKTDELWPKELIVSGNNGNIPTEVESIFKVFFPRFKFFYDAQRDNMEQVKYYLENLSNKYGEELDQTRKFYGFDGDAETKCYLTLSSEANKQAGGMLLEDKENGRYFVIMEFGDYVLSSDNWEIENIFFHELSHIYQTSLMFESLVDKYAEKLEIPFYLSQMNLERKDLLTEIIHASLWGNNGYFSRKIFGEKISAGLCMQKDSYESYIDSFSARLSERVGKYLADSRVVDGDLFKWLLDVQY